MRHLVGPGLVLLAALVIQCPQGASAATQQALWVVDPQNPGLDLPAQGRSLFDYLFSSETETGWVYDVPFPFSALLARVEILLADRKSVKGALIPIGRSLQRFAAHPDYFRYPRAVIAIDGEPAARDRQSGVMLKDRLFIGYNERAAEIEVISYNEAAGRFEFQVVKNYTGAAKAQVLYAQRSVCTLCHQNHSAIFARPNWDETNANPAVAKSLQAFGSSFHGLQVDKGIDIPDAIDNATDRANRISLYNQIWTSGCGGDSQEAIDCRRDGFIAVLQQRLSGYAPDNLESNRYRAAFAEAVARTWRQQWPGGLALPNGDIPNRSPLNRPAPDDLATLVQAQGVFNPETPRAPAEIWTSLDSLYINRIITGLSEFLADPDIQRLDHYLFTQALNDKAPARKYQSVCTLKTVELKQSSSELRLNCPRSSDNDFSLSGFLRLRGSALSAGAMRQMRVSESMVLPRAAVVAGNLQSDEGKKIVRFTLASGTAQLNARLSDGNSIRSAALSWRENASNEVDDALLEIEIQDDFARLVKATDTMAALTLSGSSDVFANKAFRRAALLQALETTLAMPAIQWCCLGELSGLAMQTDRNSSAAQPR